MKLIVIIPAYNESASLPAVLQSLLELNYNIILVDDGSTDQTAAIASSFPIIYLRHEINLGQGAALETGMEAARRMGTDIVVHFDADGQHDPRDIEHMLSTLQTTSADIIFGSRFLNRQPTGMPRLRKYLLKMAIYFNYMFTGILLSDAHNGFRIMNKKALHLIKFYQPGMAHATEIMLIVKNKTLNYTEAPVNIRYTTYSKVKGQGIMNSINILFHLLLTKKIK